MRLIALISLLFLLVKTGFCEGYAPKVDTAKHKKLNQLTVAELRKVEKAHKDYYDDCVFIKKYSSSQRLKKYPYNKAVKIVAVSYPSEFADTSSHKPGDTIFYYGLHVIDSNLYYSSLKEIKTLNSLQINRLTNLVYNTDVKVHDIIQLSHQSTCYQPRNALLFYDKNGKVFDYIEICFECQEEHSKSDRIRIGTVCNQKYDLLKKFFISLGIKYGTITKESFSGN